MKALQTRLTVRQIALLIGAVLAPGARPADATSIQDLVRIKGHEPVMLEGMGIVVGLNGTGDTNKDSLIAARPYARLLEEIGAPLASVDELARADSFAIVMVSMEIPPTGGRDGDRFDVHVETLYNAESLAGGRLIVSPLWLALPEQREQSPPAVLAGGPIVIEGTNPRSGVVRRGGQLVQSFPMRVVTSGGTVTLLLKSPYAGFPVATAIADVINTDPALSVYTDIARVEDAETIRVVLPPEDRMDPAGFLSSMLTLPVDPSLIRTEARIVINEKRGIIIVTGNVQIGPVAVSARGLTITSITPPREPTPEEPLLENRQWVGLDTTQGLGRRSTHLVDLLSALEQLKVPPEDRIAIIYELKRTGALHAEIIRQ